MQSSGLEENVFRLKKGETSELRALIVPHAGYIYSGKVAASAFRLLQEIPKRFKRVLLLGPAHRVCIQGAAFLVQITLILRLVRLLWTKC